jgi:hypothetical protein
VTAARTDTARRGGDYPETIRGDVTMKRAIGVLLSVLALGLAQPLAAQMSGMQGMGGMGGMSGMSGMQGMGGMGGMSGMSGMSGMQGMGGVSGMQGMGGMAGMSGMQGMGGMSGMSGMQGMGGMSGMSGMQGMGAIRPAVMQKVVYHVNGDDPAQQKAALGNIQNHINAVEKGSLDLKVVLHGDGVALLLYPDALAKTKMKAANANEDMQARISGLKQQGVQFQVCGNTLKARSVDPKDLYDVDAKDVVPSGVAQLGLLQSMGYAYIKP